MHLLPVHKSRLNVRKICKTLSLESLEGFVLKGFKKKLII